MLTLGCLVDRVIRTDVGKRMRAAGIKMAMSWYFCNLQDMRCMWDDVEISHAPQATAAHSNSSPSHHHSCSRRRHRHQLTLRWMLALRNR